MAKQVTRIPVKQTKKGKESEELLATISGYKAVLSTIKGEIKEQLKYKNDLANNNVRAGAECNELFIKIDELKKEAKERAFISSSYQTERENLLVILDKEQKKLNTINKDIETAEKNRKNFIRTAELEELTIREAVELAEVELTDGIDRSIEEKEDRVEKLTIDVETLEKEKEARTVELSNIADRRANMVEETAKIEDRLSVVIEVQTKEIRKAKKAAINKLKQAEELADESADQLKKLLETVSLAQQEALVATAEASRAKEALSILNLERGKAKEAYALETKTLQKKLTIAKEDLAGIQAQKFSIIKGKKDLSLLYNHIKGLYDTAGIEMPKVNIKE